MEYRGHPYQSEGGAAGPRTNVEWEPPSWTTPGRGNRPKRVVTAKADTVREETCTSIGHLTRVVRGLQSLNISSPESFIVELSQRSTALATSGGLRLE